MKERMKDRQMGDAKITSTEDIMQTHLTMKYRPWKHIFCSKTSVKLRFTHYPNV